MYKKLQSQLIRKVVALFIYRYIYHWLSVGHIIHGLLHLIVAIKRNESLKNLVCVCVCAAIQNQTEEKKKTKIQPKRVECYKYMTVDQLNHDEHDGLIRMYMCNTTNSDLSDDHKTEAI